MKTNEATTIVVLSVILRNHNRAVLAADSDPKKIARINQTTIDAIRDNAHNILPRQTIATPTERNLE